MTVWLTGRLPFLLIASAVLTAPLAALLLRLYRRAVLRSMARAATTDVAFLESTFTALWRTVPNDSPNRRLADPRAILFTTDRAAAREVDGLFRLLLAVTPSHEEPGSGEIAARASA